MEYEQSDSICVDVLVSFWQLLEDVHIAQVCVQVLGELIAKACK